MNTVSEKTGWKHIRKKGKMKIKVLLFGILAEKADEDELILEDISSLKDIKEYLFGRYPSFEEYKFRISVNQTLIEGDKKLKEGDEVALLPPFAGG